MADEIKWLWCGSKEALKKKKSLGRKPGFKFYFVHHECESGHRFHIAYSTDTSSPGRSLKCDCQN